MRLKRIIGVILAAVMICVFISACDADKGGAGAGNSAANGTESNSPGGDAGNSPGGDVSSGNPGGDVSSGSPDGGAEDAVSPDGGGGSGLTGTSEDVLVMLLDSLADSGAETPMCIPPMAVEPEMSQNTIGLSEADFTRLVEDTAYTMAAIGTFAHQIIVIRGVDERAAGEIKRLVTGDGGYDAKKWICVFPEKAVAVDSGVYVLIVASTSDVADAAVEAFAAAAGTTGDADVFWEFAGDGGEMGGISAG